MSQEAGFLELDALSMTYPGQGRPAVDAVDLRLSRGKLLAMLGPSGCGKTTTLRMIAGLIEPTSGRISVAGADITDRPVHKRGMGMVFQSYALFPHLDVARNVAFGLEMRKVDRGIRDRRVGEALAMVRLDEYAGRRVRELSGGQQQRVALARALVVEPTLLLLDEPLSNLDAKLREAMRDEIRSIVQRVGVTTVFVTHDQDEALSMADEIVVMRDGRVEQSGTPDSIYERPRTAFVADFIGRANLLQATVASIEGTTAIVDLPGLGQIVARVDDDVPAPGSMATVLIRPHRVKIVADTDGPGTVKSRAYTGDLVSYTVAVGETSVRAEALSGHGPGLAERTRVSLTWDPDDARVLPTSPEKESR